MLKHKELVSFRAWIFDYDGVLVDSSVICMQEIIATAQNLGIKIPTMKLLKDLWGRPYDLLLKDLWPNKKDRKRFYESSNAPETERELFPHVKDLVNLLYDHGVFVSIVSSRRKNSLIQNLEESGLDLLSFVLIQGLEDCAYHKPDSRVFDNALGIFANQGIQKNEIVFVGDTLIDLEASKGFEIDFLGVCSGATTKDEFLKHGVPEHMIVRSPADIYKIIKGESRQ